MEYKAKITQAREEYFIAENKPYMDVWFDILLDGQVVVKDRRLAFPLGTAKEAIATIVKQYCQMYKQDVELSEKAEKMQEDKAAAEKVYGELKDLEV